MDWRACIDPFLRRQFPGIDVAGDTDHNDNI
jgi:hypothetical protein